MARKKKLSDLLREEVEKGPEAVADVVEPEAASGQEGLMNAELMTKSVSRMTKADLLAFVKDLRAALQGAQDEVLTLKAQVQAEAVVEPQQAEGDPVIAEQLEQAKQDALGLAKENKRLLSESKQLIQEKEALQAKLERLEVAASKPPPLATRQSSAPSRRLPPRVPSRSILARPIRSAPPRRPPKKFKKNLDALGYD